jgi:hypothetical protein
MDFEIDRGFEILERTPAALSALLSGLSDVWLHSNEGADTFSPRDVVGHLIAGEETDWVARTEIILEHGADEPFTPFDRFSFEQDYEASSLEEMLETFRKLRAKNLDRIRGLGLEPEHLDLEGAHPDLGPVTLRQLLATWVVHDLAHIRQIARVMAKQYRDEVGPWREYLRVLDE